MIDQIRLNWVDPATGGMRQNDLSLPIRIGRDNANDLVLNDGRVSRQHAMIVCEDDKLILIDLDSRNGTWINNKRVTRVQLSENEAFWIGATAVEVDFSHHHSVSPEPLPTSASIIAQSSTCEQQPQPFANWGWGQIIGLRATSDGSHLLVLTCLGIVRYNTQTQEEEPLQPIEQPIDRFCLGPGEATGLSLGEDELRWWHSSPTGQSHGTIPAAIVPNNTVLAPDGVTLALDQGEFVEIISLPEGSRRLKLAIDTASPQGSLAFAPDNQSLAAAVHRSIQLWDLGSGRLYGRLPLDTSQVREMLFSPDTTHIAICSGSHLYIWNMRRAVLAQVIESAAGLFTHIAWASDSRSLAVAADGVVLVYRLGQNDPVLTIPHPELVLGLVFLDSNRELACATATSVGLYRVASGAVIRQIEGHQQGVAALAFTEHGHVLACADRSVNLRRLPAGDGVLEFPIENAPVTALASAPAGDVLAAVTANGVEIWQPHMGRHLRTLTLAVGGPTYAAFDADGQTVTILAPGGASKWGVYHSGDPISCVPMAAGDLLDIADVTSKLFAVLAGATLHIRRVEDGSLVHAIPNVADTNDLALAPDGTLVALANDDNVRIWRIADGQLLHVIPRGAGQVRFIADNSVALVRGDTIELYSVIDGSPRTTLVERACSIRTVAFAPGGDLVAAGMEDGTVRIWAI